MTRANLVRYVLELPCIRVFSKSEWKELPLKEKSAYVRLSKLKNYR